MLYLNPNDIKIIKAKKEFHSEMLDFIFRRIDRLRSNQHIRDHRAVEVFFDTVVNNHLDNILIGNPITLTTINNQIKDISTPFPDFIKGLKYVFNYNDFTKKSQTGSYDAYSLAKALDIRTCTYCNRNYTNTVINKKGEKRTRPQFDHFFDKASNPLLAISFFNLIPSCAICNSGIKTTQSVNLDDYLHPYIDNEIDKILFTYRYSIKAKSGLEIKIKAKSPRAKKTIELFALEDVYNSHAGELQDLIKTQQCFSDKYLSILNKNVLDGLNVPKEEMYRIVFGTEYDSKNFVNRPLSKFKSDILKNLGII